MGSSKTNKGNGNSDGNDKGNGKGIGNTNDSAKDFSTPTGTNVSKDAGAPFTEGEKVLAFHSNRLYEAKVRQVKYNGDRWKCFVHYLGWKNSWDEWLELDELMKHTDENMAKKRALDEEFGSDKKINRASVNKPKTPIGTKGKKRKNDAENKEKPSGSAEKLINIPIPATLKKQLVDDSEFITHLGKLVKLPRTPNVNDILKKYSDYRVKKYGSTSNSVEEIMKGLCCYFDKALSAMLLYKDERQQYQEACPENIAPSSVYGAEHLLRLFVKLPELLVRANIEEETLTELTSQLVDFLRYLQRNQNTFFLSTYHVAENIENNTSKKGR